MFPRVVTIAPGEGARSRQVLPSSTATPFSQPSVVRRERLCCAVSRRGSARAYSTPARLSLPRCFPLPRLSRFFLATFCLARQVSPIIFSSSAVVARNQTADSDRDVFGSVEYLAVAFTSLPGDEYSLFSDTCISTAHLISGFEVA